MPEDVSDHSSAINGAIAVCKDTEEGFRGAAVAEAGLKRQHSSGVFGRLHHEWIALNSLLTGHSEHRILEETEGGEDFSASRYRDALSHQLPATMNSLLKAQSQQLQQAHNRIKELRNASAQR